jgi:hypothetical protein
MLAVLGGSPGDGGQMTEDRSQETEVKMMLERDVKQWELWIVKICRQGFFCCSRPADVA